MHNSNKPYEAEVLQLHGRPNLVINGEPQIPILYALTDVPGGRWSWEEVPHRNIRLFYDMGIRLVQLDLFFDHILFEGKPMDLSLAKRQVQGVLDSCPEAAIFFRLHVSAPKWWIQKHPEEWTLYADTQPQPDLPWGLNRFIEEDNEAPTRVSLASEIWQHKGEEVLAEFCRQFSQTAEGRSVVGIQVASGVYGEWHYWGFMDHDPDTGPAMTKRFRQWLNSRYKNDEGLKKAWGQPDMTLEMAPVPGTTERSDAKAGLFRDPAIERNVIDYYRCQHEVVANSIIRYCKTVKENWPRPIVTGTFYGYFFSMFGRQAAGGHLELPRILDSEHIDYLSAPSVYYPEPEATGEPYRSRGLISSCQLAGKLWLDEMDKRPEVMERDNNIANIRRNMLYPYTKGGQGLWFYDFGPSGFISAAGQMKGWWDNPDYLAEIKRTYRLVSRFRERVYEHEADVLLVYDTDCYYYLGSRLKDDITHFIENWIPVALFRTGIGFDIIHFNDLFRIELDRYKAIILANTLVIDGDTRNRIHTHLASLGRHLIWVFAAGYCNREGISLENIELTTGFNGILRHQQNQLKVNLPDLAHCPLQYEVRNFDVNPLLSVSDPDSVEVGFYEAGKTCALAYKKLNDSVSWFMALPSDSPAVWRAILRECGAHFYTDETNDIIYAGGGIVVLHGKTPGQRVLHLRNGREVAVAIGQTGDTLVVDAKTGELL